MKSPTPEAQYAESVFQMQYHICAANLTNNIWRPAEHNTTIENS